MMKKRFILLLFFAAAFAQEGEAARRFFPAYNREME
jgi:hypothetical protein